MKHFRERRIINDEWIRALRKSLGLTQTELAEDLETAVSTVARWETGVSRPSPLAAKELLKLAEQASKHLSVFGPASGQPKDGQDVPPNSDLHEGTYDPGTPGKPPANP